MGKPSKGTPADGRLQPNKPKPAAGKKVPSPKAKAVGGAGRVVPSGLKPPKQTGKRPKGA